MMILQLNKLGGTDETPDSNKYKSLLAETGGRLTYSLIQSSSSLKKTFAAGDWVDLSCRYWGSSRRPG